MRLLTPPLPRPRLGYYWRIPAQSVSFPLVRTCQIRRSGALSAVAPTPLHEFGTIPAITPSLRPLYSCLLCPHQYCPVSFLIAIIFSESHLHRVYPRAGSALHLPRSFLSGNKRCAIYGCPIRTTLKPSAVCGLSALALSTPLFDPFPTS